MKTTMIVLCNKFKRRDHKVNLNAEQIAISVQKQIKMQKLEGTDFKQQLPHQWAYRKNQIIWVQNIKVPCLKRTISRMMIWLILNQGVQKHWFNRLRRYRMNMVWQTLILPKRNHDMAICLIQIGNFKIEATVWKMLKSTKPNYEISMKKWASHT